jgi:hypothetical protein
MKLNVKADMEEQHKCMYQSLNIKIKNMENEIFKWIISKFYQLQKV